jgi:hypothetical protein
MGFIELKEIKDSRFEFSFYTIRMINTINQGSKILNQCSKTLIL